MAGRMLPHLRAYDWSAWLCCTYINNTFKVTRRASKGLNEDVMFIGFPRTSLEKFTPEGSQVNKVDEKHVAISLPAELVKDGDHKQEVINWKNSIPQAKTDAKNTQPSLSDRPVSLTVVMKQVLSYDVLDQFMKRELHCKHYGRYVDDFYVVSGDKEWLHALVQPVRVFLSQELQLTLHEGKVCVYPLQYGVPFLGVYLKPWRMVISRDSLMRMESKNAALLEAFRSGEIPILRLATALASFRGVLSHGYNSRTKETFVL